MFGLLFIFILLSVMGPRKDVIIFILFIYFTNSLCKKLDIDLRELINFENIKKAQYFAMEMSRQLMAS